MSATTRIFLTHTPEMRRNLYGERALAGLRAVGEVTLHEGDEPLAAEELAHAARDCQLIVADRNTRGDAAVFERSPGLVAFLRCAVDIRNIDVPAATAQGVLVTQASAGFVPAVAELVLGFLVDLSRGVSRATAEYHLARAAVVAAASSRRDARGHRLRGDRAARRRHGRFSACACSWPIPSRRWPRRASSRSRSRAARASRLRGLLAIANEQTENLMDDARSPARARRLFVNVSAATSSTRARSPAP
jgi:D-3-phosphoglycerate dehydrogenase